MADRYTQGTTELSELNYFVRLTNTSCDEALVTLKKPLDFLASVDLLYMDFIKAAGGIKPSTAGILLLNAHALLRSGIRLALSGQLLPVFMTLRGSIESSLYANAMVVEPQLQKVWLDRNKDQTSKEACRNAFSINKMFRYLEQANERDFAEGLRDVYGATIDFGAHPNSHSLIRSMHIEELDGGAHTVNFAYIRGPDSFELRQSLVAYAEVGVAVFFVALICFDKHPNVSDLNEHALRLQAQVPSFVNSLGLGGPDG
ncbi:MAG: hypothetical protein MRK02_14505 [Candidatus Scalindua sp.]|nr:hypothetical protein [Candidatus Scalindua sp.]